MTRRKVEFDWIDVPTRRVLREDGSWRSVDPFQVARWPVTVAQFESFVEATDYLTTAERRGDANTFRHSATRRKLIRAQIRPEADTAMYVSYDDAFSFCTWARVSLPTEDQWLAASVLDWRNRYQGGTGMIDAINDMGKRHDAMRGVGVEWTRDAGSLRQLHQAVPTREVYEQLFVIQQLGDLTDARWAIVRSDPVYVLASEWATITAGCIVPCEFTWDMIGFRVCRTLDHRTARRRPAVALEVGEDAVPRRRRS